MQVRVIKTETDYAAVLDRIDQLMDMNPGRGTPEAEELELLSLLVENYEKERYRISPPDPIDAILFRMEQQNLSPRDLIPFIGSRSRVSEVLSRKRPLTVPMMRALHEGLGIPASVLLKHPDRIKSEEGLQWSRFPLKEMNKRGWIKANARDLETNSEKLMKDFLSPLKSENWAVALYRQTQNIRSAGRIDKYALAAWTAHILIRASKNPVTVPFKPEMVTLGFMREVARLSWSDRGPLLAQEFLRKHGIDLIIEPHLSKTHLDGAAMMTDDNRPVICLTLRHDRIDNFWFVLMHELVHVGKHLTSSVKSFFDDLDVPDQSDLREKEADGLAQEILVPYSEWGGSSVRDFHVAEAAMKLADKLKIHPAIVAGRVRNETKNFRLFNHLVGFGQVRKLFPDDVWS